MSKKIFVGLSRYLEVTFYMDNFDFEKFVECIEKFRQKNLISDNMYHYFMQKQSKYVDCIWMRG